MGVNRIGRLVDVLDDPPSPNSVDVMKIVDSLPFAYRALVHEFGVVIVTEIMAEATDATDCRQQLEYWRSQRQAQWLATDYVGRRSFRKAA